MANTIIWAACGFVSAVIEKGTYAFIKLYIVFYDKYFKHDPTPPKYYFLYFSTQLLKFCLRFDIFKKIPALS